MIVRDLLIKLGFRSDVGSLDKTDRRLASMRERFSALDVAAGQMLASLASQGVGKIADTLKEGVDQSVQFGPPPNSHKSNIWGGGRSA